MKKNGNLAGDCDLAVSLPLQRYRDLKPDAKLDAATVGVRAFPKLATVIELQIETIQTDDVDTGINVGKDAIELGCRLEGIDTSRSTEKAR